MKRADILRHAKDYLDKLDNHIDPITGQHLPKNSVGREDAVHKALFFTSKNLGWIIAHDDADGLQPFSLTSQQIKELKPADGQVRATELIGQINKLVDMTRYRNLTTATIRGWLCEQGYLRHGETPGRCSLTPQGRAVGIMVYNGKLRDELNLSPSAQRLLLDHLEDIIRYGQANPVQEQKKTVTLEHPEMIRDNYRSMLLLSQGRHPFTKAPLGKDDPLNGERLRTCFSYVAAALSRSLKAGYFTARSPFSLPRELWAQVPTSQPLSVAGLSNHINALLPDLTAAEKLTGPQLRGFLCAKGFMEEVRTSAGRTQFSITPEGAALGIGKVECTMKDGTPYEVDCISPSAQEYLARHMDELTAFCAK